MGLFNFFKKKEQRNEIATCYGCKRKIYEGDKYGHDDEPGNLLLGGVYFCNTCIGRHVSNDIIFSHGQQRYRLKIKQ